MKIRLFKKICSVVLAVFIFSGPAVAWIEKSQTKMNKIIQKSGIPEAQLSIFVAPVEHQIGSQTPVIKELSSQKKMIPASISKLVTAATVISKFQPGSKFKTSLWSSAKVEGRTLKGDLYLKGGGDPSFVSETMWYLVNVFVRNQIDTIEGDLVIDDSLFDQVRFDLSRQKERVDRAYDAPTGAMSFNWNSVNIFVRPAKKAGEPAQVFLDPENDYVRLVNKVETKSAGTKTQVAADRDEDPKNEGDVLLVTGRIAQDSSELVIYKNMTKPDLWAGHNLKSFLKQRGIKVIGKVRTGIVPANAQNLAEAESKPIEDILADMNKFSNNYVAEMLAKNLGALVKKPGSIAQGVQSMKEYLLSLGVSSDEFEFQNPSGLTRENRMTAQSLWRVLQKMQQEYSGAPEFMKSLPIAGVDGTLKNRMKSSVAERWVRAKTGYLTGVVSLAGYAGRKDGSIIPFVFIFNGSADESKVRLLFDDMAKALVE